MDAPCKCFVERVALCKIGVLLQPFFDLCFASWTDLWIAPFEVLFIFVEACNELFVSGIRLLREVIGDAVVQDSLILDTLCAKGTVARSVGRRGLRPCRESASDLTRLA